jgi:large subunit ribosomal protein L13
LTKVHIPVFNRNLRLSLDVERAVRTYLQGLRRGKVQWHVLDAEGQVLGRLASRAAMLLMGKTCADFTPHQDHRDGLIIVNAAKVRFTGKKLDDKIYRHHTGYPGGLKEISARKRMEMHPEDVVRDAVTGMLPKSRIGSRLAARLKVYAGAEHPHAGQQPQAEDRQKSA